MDMKKCSRCGAEKPLYEFHRRSEYARGPRVMSWCRQCHKNWCAKYRNTHREQLREYQRAYQKRRVEKPEERKKIAARVALRAAIKSGLIKQLPCAECGEPKTEAHHEDYDKPLDVVWLCEPHHSQRHWK